MAKLPYTNEMIKKGFLNSYGEVPPSFYKFVDDYKKGLFHISPYTIRDRFNGYKPFIKFCGYDTKERIDKNGVNRGYKLERERQKRKKYINYSKSEVGKKLYEAFWDCDYVNNKTIKDYYNQGKLPFGEGVIKRHYGCMLNAFKEIGLYHLITARKHSYFSKKEIIDTFVKRFPNKEMPPSQLEVDKKYKESYLFFNVSNLISKFGSYSKFLLEAVYNYNKGKYSQKYLAKDGVVCDSKSEYKVDVFLHKNNIKHKHHVKYNKIIEGLDNQSKVDFIFK